MSKFAISMVVSAPVVALNALFLLQGCEQKKTKTLPTATISDGGDGDESGERSLRSTLKPISKKISNSPNHETPGQKETKQTNHKHQEAPHNKTVVTTKCGNTAYNDTKQTCCGGVSLHDMIQVGDEKRLFKCGLGCGEAGDYGAGEKCCLDGIYPDPKGTKWKCCTHDDGSNGQGYDTTKNTCFDGVVVDGVGNSKCGNTAYDDNKQTCCDGVLHDMIQVGDEKRLFKCGLGCGEAGDYGAGEKCCLDGIYPDPKGTKWKCCKYDNGNNGQGYDTTKNTCANGVVGVGNSKCGNTAYDTTKNTCFDGVVVDGVGNSKCGNTAYDDNKQTCCDGVLHDMIQVGDEKRLFKCGLGCGEAGDYGAGEKCCLDGIYPDPKGTKWKCCTHDDGSNGQGYDTTKNTCFDGVVVDGVGNSKCGNTAYDDNKQTCCDGVLHDMIQVGDEKRLFKCGLGCGEAGDYGAGREVLFGWHLPGPQGHKMEMLYP